MPKIKMESLQENLEEIDLETLERYMAKATQKSINLLKEHTNLVCHLYQHGLTDFNEAIHLQHVNKRLCRELRMAHRAKAPALVQQAVDLAIKEKGTA
jgi:hypothetical protein